MKALAASSIGQYEKAVASLNDYYRTVELGLSVCLREAGPAEKVKAGSRSALLSSVPTRASWAVLTRWLWTSPLRLSGSILDLFGDSGRLASVSDRF